MLTHVHVKNIALIDEAEVDFGPGLNILTGETGAGKSILIDSVGVALGKKVSKDMIREGADTALAELVFQIHDPDIEKLLEEMDAKAEDGQVILSRKISAGRSICKINGEISTAAQLRRVAEVLLDIHGQHEHQSLL
ncbi:MAG TPA: DNA repair protein RecN, partial [Lachnospiraceae bacterium]|nr:DNA repair protein RecN [Lachnospiraceae bacterium]